MDRLSAFETFAAVARAGSFSAAARQLRCSPQAVTRNIAALEAHLGLRLLHRTTRAVSLTGEGAALLPRAERLLTELADTERALRGSGAEPSGELYVTAPVAFGRLHVMPAVTDLLARHPRLDIRLLLVDRNIRMVEEGIDVAVRIGVLSDSALHAVRIGTVRQVIVASPGYLARHGAPTEPADLAQHHLIASTGPRGAGEWRLGGRRDASDAARRRLQVNTVDAALAAAEAGVGLANFLSYQVADALAAGRLVEVLRPDEPEPLPVSLLFEAARSAAPATRAFVEAMKQRAAEGRWT
ncbi:MULTISPECIES: LysR family transcriptional regulator [unclassified Novosphingobium]|uniref:LysR family transcriptional regulator n=1 Tax=unclassified Novosphingobium TaxID=2644732 RepID=UPI000ED0C6CA|nr:MULTISPECIES: LysR family transcriptional regulator [unclassified Novosphingobium]HCF24022.1 LysR family transcriptional regulator [Novosphingobium sp.]HQV04468.1 LysR family transcriptional regulator [Novosphingobium sp.]